MKTGVRLTNPDREAPLHLFCLPYAGGGASLFRTWSAALPSEVAVHAVQLPGREERLSESPYTRMAPLTDDLAEALLPYLAQPFAIFGHSLGALVAYEATRTLRRRYSKLPLQLFVSACRAPRLHAEDSPIHALPEAEFVNEIRALSGTPPEVFASNELMQIMVPLLRADFELFETYSYREEEPIACPIIGLGGLRDPEVSSENIAAWREHTHGPFRLHMFPGDHFFLQSARPKLLGVLSDHLNGLLATQRRSHK